jgi:hypothetical protein
VFSCSSAGFRPCKLPPADFPKRPIPDRGRVRRLGYPDPDAAQRRALISFAASSIWFPLASFCSQAERRCPLHRPWPVDFSCLRDSGFGFSPHRSLSIDLFLASSPVLG